MLRKLSRSLEPLRRLVQNLQTAGFFNVCGKAPAVIGPALRSFVQEASRQPGILTMLLTLVTGAAILFLVPWLTGKVQ